MAGGGGSPIARVIGQINQAERIGNSGSPGFVAPSQLGQQATYRPNMPVMSPQMSPLTQQLMQRSMAPQPIMGLPAALMQMQGQLNQPMMRGPMPVYQNPALNYRPNMQAVQENLSRVAPRFTPQIETGGGGGDDSGSYGGALQSYYDSSGPG